MTRSAPPGLHLAASHSQLGQSESMRSGNSEVVTTLHLSVAMLRVRCESYIVIAIVIVAIVHKEYKYCHHEQEWL